MVILFFLRKKNDFRPFFLLFTASVRSRPPEPPLVPGVFVFFFLQTYKDQLSIGKLSHYCINTFIPAILWWIIILSNIISQYISQPIYSILSESHQPWWQIISEIHYLYHYFVKCSFTTPPITIFPSQIADQITTLSLSPQDRQAVRR